MWPRPVAWGIVAWAIVVDVCLFIALTKDHLGISGAMATAAYWLAFVATIALGWWLGWRRRTGTSFAAPILAWIIFVPFAFASEFVRVGLLHGLFRGFGLAIIGGFIAAFVEGVVLVAFAVLGRIAVGAIGPGEPDVMIFPPSSS
jgi:hypothetical protein